MLVQGSGTMVFPFRDGIYCMSNPTERMEFTMTGPSGNASSSVSITTVGGTAAGMKTYYQWYYRNIAGTPCGGGANFASAVEILWD